MLRSERLLIAGKVAQLSCIPGNLVCLKFLFKSTGKSSETFLTVVDKNVFHLSERLLSSHFLNLPSPPHKQKSWLIKC